MATAPSMTTRATPPPNDFGTAPTLPCAMAMRIAPSVTPVLLSMARIPTVLLLPMARTRPTTQPLTMAVTMMPLLALVGAVLMASGLKIYVLGRALEHAVPPTMGYASSTTQNTTTAIVLPGPSTARTLVVGGASAGCWITEISFQEIRASSSFGQP